MSDEETLELAAGFAGPTRDDWLAAVDKVLKGRPISTITRSTSAGLVIEPLYTAADVEAVDEGPGGPTGRRGDRLRTPGSGAADDGGWGVRTDHAHPDPAVANAQILEDLERGVTSIRLVVDAATREGFDPDDEDGRDLVAQGGVSLPSIDELDRLLDGVLLDLAEIVIDGGANAPATAGLLLGLWDRRGIAPEAALGAFGIDPLGVLAATGRLPRQLDSHLADLADVLSATSDYTQVSPISVDSSAYVAAGATDVDELAIAIATAVEYLRAVASAEGGPALVRDAAARTEWTLAAGADQFAAIAKFRAVRQLRNRVLEACGLDHAERSERPIRLHARSSDRDLTGVDPWVNLLRGTVACFAAATSGADTITVAPFDVRHGLPSDLARRQARNTQRILLEESRLDHVVDPAGGSWYVEQRTDALAEAAWARFQEIEAAGGMAAALTGGTISAWMASARRDRFAASATRRTPVTGVSEFPFLGEGTPDVSKVDVSAAAASAAQRVAASRAGQLQVSISGGGEDSRLRSLVRAGATVGQAAALVEDLLADLEEDAPEPTELGDPLVAFRPSAPWEDLRSASNAHLEEHGVRPRVFLATLGPVAVHTARATWASNAFEAAGIEAVTGEGDADEGYADAAAAVAGFASSGARIAVICSSDEVYAESAADVAGALKAAGARHVTLAGKPGDAEAELISAGVDTFIHVGADIFKAMLEAARRASGPPAKAAATPAAATEGDPS